MNANAHDRVAPCTAGSRLFSPIRWRRAFRGGHAAARVRFACALTLAAATGGCATPGGSALGSPPGAPMSSQMQPVALPAAAADADFLLLGELHDNVTQHRLRLQWLEALADRHPFALALEQFDADRQDALDRARAEDTREAANRTGAPDLAVRARRIAQAAGFDFHGWDWDLYRPAIELALRRGLPLVAANLSPADTTQVARGSVPPAPPPPGWGTEQTEAMRASIRQGHCDLLPERAVDAMALAQRTRDARIARALVDARERTGLPVVLLAGNGHLRRDIGVPLHLAALRPQARIVSIAMLERNARGEEGRGVAPDQESFDLIVRTAAQPREDPCVALRERMQRRSSSADSR
ncbi:MAG: ChaN family lipoprotein [Burkholderiaceae bacterium]|nr:ChaN family lipoprotein [Burkholderiaceae bacterium]